MFETTKLLTLYLVSEESEPLQEALSQFESVFNRVFLDLSAQLLGLLAHAVLQNKQWWVLMMVTGQTVSLPLITYYSLWCFPKLLLLLNAPDVKILYS